MGYSFLPSAVTPAYLWACCYDNYLQQQTYKSQGNKMWGFFFSGCLATSDLEDTVLTQKKESASSSDDV